MCGNPFYSVPGMTGSIPRVGKREKVSSQPKDIKIYKKQIMHRSNLIGSQELETLLTDYLNLHMSEMTYQDIEEFDQVVFRIENPLLKRYLVSGDVLEPEHDTPIMRKLQMYGCARSREFSLPSPGQTAI